MYNFDVKKATEGCIQWIRDWFEANGKGCTAVLGVSGGKDSSVVAALCCEALGKERVFGVLMPDGEQCDIDYSHDLCDFLGIDNIVVNIHEAVQGVYNAINGIEISTQTRINLPPPESVCPFYTLFLSLKTAELQTPATFPRTGLATPHATATARATSAPSPVSRLQR